MSKIIKKYLTFLEREYGRPPFGPGAQDYYGQDVEGPGEFEDAEKPKRGEKKRYFWKKKSLEEIKMLYEFEKIQEGDNLKCNICGRIVHVKEAGQGPLICCNLPMEVL